MSLEWAKAFAKVLRVPLDDVLSHAGVLDGDTPHKIGQGFSESDAVPFAHKRDTDARKTAIVAAFGGDRPGIDAWEVRQPSLAFMGYMPGDVILVDTHLSELTKAGDVVLAQIYDNGAGGARTVLRRHEPPVLVAFGPDTDDRRVHVVDNNNVAIRGKVIASWRGS